MVDSAGLDQRYIAVEGPIGVGKTSLARLLAERLVGRLVLEEVEDNPFLARFYQDIARYALPTQLFFLLSRWQQQQQLLQTDLFAAATVSDYVFAKDRIFASLTLQPAELALYDRVYDALGPRVPQPDLVIFLQCRLEVLLQRIKRRGRDFERHFDADYLEALSRAYNDFFFHYTDTPLLVVDTNAIDFVNQPDDYEDLVRRILSHRQGTLYYRPIEKGRTS